MRGQPTSLLLTGSQVSLSTNMEAAPQAREGRDLVNDVRVRRASPCTSCNSWGLPEKEQGPRDNKTLLLGNGLRGEMSG